METEILAVTGFLTAGIYVKQVSQFLPNDNCGLGGRGQFRMWLKLDSANFLARGGHGRAKRLATRMRRTQQTMRKKWLTVEQISTKENLADLNAKALSHERRKFLMRKIGLKSDQSEEENLIPQTQKPDGEVDRQHAVGSNFKVVIELQTGHVRGHGLLCGWRF